MPRAFATDAASRRTAAVSATLIAVQGRRPPSCAKSKVRSSDPIGTYVRLPSFAMRTPSYSDAYMDFMLPIDAAGPPENAMRTVTGCRVLERIAIVRKVEAITQK